MLHRRTFRGGIHPLRHIHYGKTATQAEPIRPISPPALLVIPMAQSAGAPCTPLVKKGDTVLLGQKIGEPKGFVGAPVYASASGIVKKIEQREIANGVFSKCILIENDGLDTRAPLLPTFSLEDDPLALRDAVLESGLVGMGGAAFPTHVKLTPPPGKEIDTVIVNAAECEPYLTCDHRMMLEHPQDILLGLRYTMRILAAKKGLIAVEDNKPDAIESLRHALGEDSSIQILSIPAKYPQGSEKHMIYALTRRIVPSRGLPADVGCVVINVSTAATLTWALRDGFPFTHRALTVTGSVAKPSNLLVPIGTPVKDVLAACGGISGPIERLIFGGPMMGVSLFSDEVPVVKGTSGLVALANQAVHRSEHAACIRCGRCVSACPMKLMPTMLSTASKRQEWDRLEKLHAMDCIECGSCAYTCPACCDILTNIRLGKRVLMARRNK